MSAYKEKNKRLVIRKVVKDVLEQAKAKEVRSNLMPGLDIVVEKVEAVYLKTLWCFIFIVSFSMCLLLTYQNVIYYLSEPVAVDVTFDENTTSLAEFAPEILLCDQATPEIFNLIGYVYERFSFMNLMIDLMDAKNVLDLNLIWNASDFMKTDHSLLLELRNHTKIDISPMGKVYHPLGLCASFLLDEIVNVHNALRLEATIHTINKHVTTRSVIGISKSLHQEWDNKNSWSVVIGTVSSFQLLIKKYIFKPTSQMPCKENKIFTNCAKNCLKNEFETKFNCSFPFMPSEVNLPVCQTHEINSQLYLQASSIYYRLNPVKEPCNCIRSCERIVFGYILNVLENPENFTTILFDLTRTSVSFVTQRYVFEFIDLLCGIGGSLALFLNFSVLSLFQLIALIFSHYANGKNSLQTKMLHIKTKRIFQTTKNELEIHSGNKTLVSKAIGTVALILCLLASGYHIISRIQLYLTYSTSTLIQISENETVYYPQIILCNQNSFKVTVLRTVAEQFGVDICDVNHDIMLNSTLYKKLWSTRNGEFKPIMKAHESRFHDFVANLTVDSIKTYLRLCQVVTIEPQLFAGTNSFAFVQPSFLHVPGCQFHNYQLFIRKKNDYLPVYSYTEIPNPARSLISFEAKEVSYLNKPKVPCVTSEINDQCMFKCVEDLTIKNTPCRFEFMNISKRLCNESDDIVKIYKSYKLIHSRMHPKSCGCIRKCEELIYDVRVFSQYASDHFFTIVYGNNIIETVKETWNYRLDQMLSDIGAALGLTLGVSLMSLFSILHLAIKTVLRCQAKLQKRNT